jgi:hypothetical protein
MKRGKKAAAGVDDLADQLSDALGFVECAMTSLRDAEQAWPALLVLEYGVKELRAVHRNLDRMSPGPR